MINITNTHIHFSSLLCLYNIVILIYVLMYFFCEVGRRRSAHSTNTHCMPLSTFLFLVLFDCHFRFLFEIAFIVQAFLSVFFSMLFSHATSACQFLRLGLPLIAGRRCAWVCAWAAWAILIYFIRVLDYHFDNLHFSSWLKYYEFPIPGSSGCLRFTRLFEM